MRALRMVTAAGLSIGWLLSPQRAESTQSVLESIRYDVFGVSAPAGP